MSANATCDREQEGDAPSFLSSEGFFFDIHRR